MEEFSYYFTIFCLILIQISFYWLFRNDHCTRKLNNQYIKQNGLLVIVALGNGNSSGVHCEISEQLKNELEATGFVVYGIRLMKRQQLSNVTIENNVIQLELNNLHHYEQMVELIKRELTLNGRKLHAYICLPTSLSASIQLSQQLIELIQEIYLAYFQLLTSLTSLIVNNNARLIQVQGSIECQNCCRDKPLLDKFARLLDKCIYEFLSQNKATLGKNLIKVKICSPKGSNCFSWMMQQFSKLYDIIVKDELTSNNNLNASHQPIGWNCDDKTISGSCSSSSSWRHQDQLIETIKNLLVLDNPKDTKVIKGNQKTLID